ncbi:MAG: hypothetical protein NTZ05_11980, partial [Chloroflexi bacterium]|nr:hypothetical protein [Chloroflexota bacterium]
MNDNPEMQEQAAAERRWALWNFIMRPGSVLCLQSADEDRWVWYALLRDHDIDGPDAAPEAPSGLHLAFALPWEGDRDGGLVISRYYGVTLTAATPELYEQLEAALDRIRERGFVMEDGRHSAPPPELLTATPPDDIPGLADAVRSLSARNGLPEPAKPPRKSNRKASLPWNEGLFLVPNIGNHGTRHLGLLAAGAGTWMDAPDGAAKLAILDGRGVVGMVELTDGEDGARRIFDALGPRTLKTLVGL